MPKPGRCVHCLKTVDTITDDHLFPRSWYPDTTPANLEKWKIPACQPCNNQYGALESELRLMFAACVDPHGEASSGVWKKALDGLNPERARSPFDSLKRKLARQRFLKKLRPVTGDLLKHTLPEIKERPIGTIALTIPANKLQRLVEKLARGTVYLADRQYLEHKQIGMSLIRPADEGELVQLFQFGEQFERGSAIRISRAVNPENGDMFFRFDIWDQFRLFAYAVDPSPLSHIDWSMRRRL